MSPAKLLGLTRLEYKAPCTAAPRPCSGHPTMRPLLLCLLAALCSDLGKDLCPGCQGQGQKVRAARLSLGAVGWGLQGVRGGARGYSLAKQPSRPLCPFGPSFWYWSYRGQGPGGREAAEPWAVVGTWFHQCPNGLFSWDKRDSCEVGLSVLKTGERLVAPSNPSSTPPDCRRAQLCDLEQVHLWW